MTELQKKAGYKPGGFKDLYASINKVAHGNALMATTGGSDLLKKIRRNALLDKVNDKGLTVPTTKRVARARPRKRVEKKGPKMGEGMNIGIDESKGDLQNEGLDFGPGGFIKEEKFDKASTKEERQGVVEDDTLSLWKIVSRRYKRSGYPRLLKKKTSR